MTQLLVIAVGRMKPGPLLELAQTYCKRLTQGGIGPVKIVELDVRPQPTPELQKQKEGDAILAKLPEGAMLCALDERGETFASPVFANWIERVRLEGPTHLVFVIGGADGLDPRIRAGAKLVIAFGEMTWPHMMVRVMLLEQLYRAQQILAGHPYHRI